MADHIVHSESQGTWEERAGTMSEAGKDDPHKLTTSAIAFIDLYKAETVPFSNSLMKGIRSSAGELMAVGGCQRSGSHCLQ